MFAAFTAVDWGVFIVFLASVVFAAIKGLVREFIRLGALVLAFLLASWFYSAAAAPFKDIVKSENIALFCGFSIVFLGTLLAGTLVGAIVSRFVKVVKLQWFDRCLGALFGVVRGWLLGGMIFAGLMTFSMGTSSVRNSELAPYFLPASRFFSLLTPADFSRRFRTEYEAIERWWKSKY